MPKDTQPTSPSKFLNIFVTLELKCLMISKLISKQCNYSILATNKDLSLHVLQFWALQKVPNHCFGGRGAHTRLVPCLVQLVLENNHLFLQLVLEKNSQQVLETKDSWQEYLHVAKIKYDKANILNIYFYLMTVFEF